MEVITGASSSENYLQNHCSKEPCSQHKNLSAESIYSLPPGQAKSWEKNFSILYHPLVTMNVTPVKQDSDFQIFYFLHNFKRLLQN